jgi:hypothetical protein
MGHLKEKNGNQKSTQEVFRGRKFEFDVERVVFFTALYRLFMSDSEPVL